MTIHLEHASRRRNLLWFGFASVNNIMNEKNRLKWNNERVLVFSVTIKPLESWTTKQQPTDVQKWLECGKRATKREKRLMNLVRTRNVSRQIAIYCFLCERFVLPSLCVSVSDRHLAVFWHMTMVSINVRRRARLTPISLLLTHFFFQKSIDLTRLLRLWRRRKIFL